jgi:hypothetical protein
METASLLLGLRRLDGLLEAAVGRARAIYGPEAAADLYRGLHIRVHDIERLLERPPGEALLWPAPGDAEDSLDLIELWDRLGVYPLEAFDRDVLLLSIAPEIDQRYDRIFAFLQDDITRRRPTVDLALNLLCATPEARLASRARFSPDAPLLRNGLIRLVADPDHVEPTLLARYITPDDQVLTAVFGTRTLDRHLATCADLARPHQSPSPVRDSILRELAAELRAGTRETLRVSLVGADGAERRAAAQNLAWDLGTHLLVVDLARALEGPTAAESVVRRVFREARLHMAVLYLVGLDVILGPSANPAHDSICRALAEEIARSRGVVILSTEQSWRPLFAPQPDQSLGLVHIEIEPADFARRRATWAASIRDLTCRSPGDADLDTLADRFRLTPTQIRESVAMARARSSHPGLFDLLTAARAQSGHELASLAVKIDPVYGWSDLVLPDDASAQLRELCRRVSLRHHVFDTWRFGRASRFGGVSALFAGPSGTGKTMAAEVVAGELEVDLYRINLAGVVSKYIGETEKNLDRIFDAADRANAILFFDEADALFGKRTEVRDSHDRYANIEISYLLQRMEQYVGVAILATNLRANLDEAFTRRLSFVVHFPSPDESCRRRIWNGIWSAEQPLAPEVDLEYLAREFPLTGGNIRNIALSATFLAAEDRCPVTMAHLFLALRREYQKMGKQLSERELWDAYRQQHARVGAEHR